MLLIGERITDIGKEYVFKHQDLQMFGLKFEKKSSFHPFEVVGRGSETQLQVNDIGDEICVKTSRFANICAQSNNKYE